MFSLKLKSLTGKFDDFAGDGYKSRDDALRHAMLIIGDEVCDDSIPDARPVISITKKYPDGSDGPTIEMEVAKVIHP